MSYTIKYDDDTKTVYTVVEGMINVELGTKFATEAYREGGQYGCEKYLFDLRNTTVNDSIIYIAKFALNMETVGIKTEFYVAVIAINNELKHRFFNAMSKNRGYSRSRYFSDYELATRWLSKY